MRSRVLLASLLALTAGAAGTAIVVLLAGPLGADSPRPMPSAAPAAQPPAAPAAPAHQLQVPSCTAGGTIRLDRGAVTYAATVRTRASAYRTPGGAELARFERVNQNGVPTVFGILGARVDSHCKASWYHVQLPIRPNGITGWVRARDVTQRALHVHVVVDLSSREVMLFRGTKRVLVTKAAIGASSTPTPLGRYFVNQKLVAPDASGPFGPFAIGISAFSPVLQDWAQGGPIAIHGTNEPQLIGSAVSHGCVRVPNAKIEALWKLVPTGTPVLVRM